MLYVNDGSDNPPRLAVYQAEWGMWGLGTGGRDWSMATKLERCCAAGFEGVLVFQLAPTAEGREFVDATSAYGLALGYGTFAATPQGIAEDVTRATSVGAAFVNAQMHDYFLRGEAARDCLKETVRIGREAGIPLFVETHRACVTQDLLRTTDYVRAIPELTLTNDFSHYVVAGQLPTVPSGAGPISDAIEDQFDILLKRTACFHGRVSNGQAVQVDIGRDGDDPAVEPFRRWWRKGMTYWLQNAGPGDILPFVVELGPPPYSITIRSANGAAEAEISDRWQQAVVMKQLATSLWEEVTAGT